MNEGFVELVETIATGNLFVTATRFLAGQFPQPRPVPPRTPFDSRRVASLQRMPSFARALGILL